MLVFVTSRSQYVIALFDNLMANLLPASEKNGAAEIKKVRFLIERRLINMHFGIENFNTHLIRL